MNTFMYDIFATATTTITVSKFLYCLLASLLIGGFFTFIYTRKSRCSEGFTITIALLPAIVCMVIMMVNGNVGTGVAVAGAFSLVRFRSVPGSAKEIGILFLSMASGFITGMGYLGYAFLFSLVMGTVFALYQMFMTSRSNKKPVEKTLRITIPEDLNYGDIFDDLFELYASKWNCVSVKTTNLGSLFKLEYNLVLKNPAQEKEFIDELRCRNGNLEINIYKTEVNPYEL